MVEVVVMTGQGSIPQAVEAMRLGARTYLQKPFPTPTLMRLLSEIEQLKGLRQGISGRGGLIGASRSMRRVYAQIDMAAACELPVLIRGETGTGKELAAHAIHALGKRQGKPFIAINCSAIPRELAESELFGHEAGALGGGAGEGAGFVAEQFRFQQAVGDSGAIDLEQGGVPAPGQVVQALRRKFLASAPFTEHQDRPVDAGQSRYLVECAGERARMADHVDLLFHRLNIPIIGVFKSYYKVNSPIIQCDLLGQNCSPWLKYS